MSRVDTSNITFVGHPFAPIGVGEHIRAPFRAMKWVGAAPSLLDVYGVHRHHDPDLEDEFRPHLVHQLSDRLNIFWINGDEVDPVLKHLADPNFSKAYNVIVPSWELARFPEIWVKTLERFDEVWSLSRFIHDAIAQVVKRPVTYIPQSAEVKVSNLLGRRHFGLPEDAFLFLFFFDLSSYIERKNPWALLDAFNRLRARHPGASMHCVLKYKGRDEDSADAIRLQKELKRHGDTVHVITRQLLDVEIKNLVRACDCFVSLHRAEGYGRAIAEALALGVPTIATDYSGNTDFMAPGACYPVRYDLVPVPAGAYPHAEGQVWAEPSVEHAVDLMERVFRDPDDARQTGLRGRRHMLTNASSLSAGLGYLARCTEILAGR